MWGKGIDDSPFLLFKTEISIVKPFKNAQQHPFIFWLLLHINICLLFDSIKSLSWSVMDYAWWGILGKISNFRILIVCQIEYKFNAVLVLYTVHDEVKCLTLSVHWYQAKADVEWKLDSAGRSEWKVEHLNDEDKKNVYRKKKTPNNIDNAVQYSYTAFSIRITFKTEKKMFIW